MTCLLYKAAKTYKKMIKSKLCWNDLLHAKKITKSLKAKKMYCTFDRYILFCSVCLYQRPSSISPHVLWVICIQMSNFQIVVQHTVKWWSCDFSFCFTSFASTWFSDISDHLIFLINTKPSVRRTSYLIQLRVLLLWCISNSKTKINAFKGVVGLLFTLYGVQCKLR